MTLSVTALAWLVSGALLITALAPLLLLVLWFRDWKEGQLW